MDKEKILTNCSHKPKITSLVLGNVCTGFVDYKVQKTSNKSTTRMLFHLYMLLSLFIRGMCFTHRLMQYKHQYFGHGKVIHSQLHYSAVFSFHYCLAVCICMEKLIQNYRPKNKTNGILSAGYIFLVH